MGKLSRRDFLRLAALIPAAAYLPSAFWGLKKLRYKGNSSLPNVIVIVFDAMSARNLSVYGYPRKTAPNFERFAERAIVYHSHYSAGNYTTPGTASLLTGMYPWTHRAINQSGQVASRLAKRNIFSLLGEEYNRYAFGQNSWANIFLNQFDADIDYHVPVRSFGAISPWVTGDWLKDANLGYQAIDSFLFSKGDPPASLVFGLAERLYGFNKSKNLKAKDYPNGLPQVLSAPFYYRMDDLFTGLVSLCTELRPPYFAYLHVYPPHDPYKPSKDFRALFQDDWVPQTKPQHRLAVGRDSDDRLNARRANYDRFIANLDAEFGRLLSTLEDSGILDDSYVILTSDHGEMFERGEQGHSTPLLYDPVVHSPLLISVPGQEGRKDIYSPTNSIDLLPTLLYIAGREIPEWCEGKILPGLGGSDDLERSTFSVEAKLAVSFAPLKIATIAMRKGTNKMIYYTGYESTDAFEVYDLANDPEEMEDLVPKNASIVSELKTELMMRFEEANQALRAA